MFDSIEPDIMAFLLKPDGSSILSLFLTPRLLYKHSPLSQVLNHTRPLQLPSVFVIPNLCQDLPRKAYLTWFLRSL